VGGTSASSPNFAAVIALVNDALLAKGKKPLGFLNPWLYSKAHKTFTDVTIGSSYGCETDGFPAQKGWDAVTGWGTPVSSSNLVIEILSGTILTNLTELPQARRRCFQEGQEGQQGRPRRPGVIHEHDVTKSLEVIRANNNSNAPYWH
jgi:subtilase family serine protease